MGTEIALRSIPAPTPQIAKSLSPQGLQDHRAAIAFEVKTHVKFYERDDRVVAAKIAWWCDELQDWTQEQVVWALREWNRESPRVDPSPGDILGLMKAMRGKREAEKMASLPKPPEPERTPVSKERAREIMEAAGFAPKAFPGTGEGQA